MNPNKTYQEIIDELSTNQNTGLTDSEVLKRREKYGLNELASKKKTPFILKFLSQFADFLVIILIIAALLSVVVDTKAWIEEKGWIETIIIIVVILINAFVGTIQENNAEKSLDALKKMSTPQTKVIREGKLITINSNELVPGDIFYIEAGDFVPADARVIQATNLLVDESALTGESVPVIKTSDIITKESPALGDMINCLFSSTYVTNGKGYAVVTGTGMNTEIGKIAEALMNTDELETPLQKRLTQIGKVIGIMCIAICVVVFALEFIESLIKGGHEWLNALKTATALAVAAIPEGLATIVTVVLAIGVQKMAKQKAIVKKLPAVETLGCASVICSDKTGTLTQNKMTVLKLYNTKIKDIDSELTYEESKMLEFFALCTDASYEVIDGKEKKIGDPTEIALLIAKNKYVKKPEFDGYTRCADIPFDSDRKLMTVIYPYFGKYIIITKGAPDVIIRISKNANLAEALEANNQMAQMALRVLGVGYKIVDELPLDMAPAAVENNLEFLGLVGMIDPARPEVKEAIRVASNAGIKTVMITGDHILTAKAIAKDLNILQDGDLAISSKELAALSDEELYNNIEKYSVYARVAPEDKVRIVETWQKKGKIVAMTGDGVNDSPALKKADIGCAMGITGTDVAKEAADIVLVDDNFSTIVTAVKEGRGIYDNIRKVVHYLLSSNIGEVLTIFLASLISLIVPFINFGIPLVATHLLWINLITDSLPAFALGTELPEPEIMNEPPRKKDESFFSNGLGLRIILQGIMVGALALGSYAIGNFIGSGTEAAKHAIGQTMAFLTLSSSQLFHSFNIKSHKTIFSKTTFNNKFLIIAFLLGMILQVLICYTPGLNSAFNLVALDPLHLIIAIGLGATTIIFSEIGKLIKKK